MHSNLSPRVASASDNLLPLSLLVVDDSAFDRARLRRMCHATGLRFDWNEASGAAQMLDHLSQNAVDVVLLDYLLPDIDGLECAARVRSFHEDCPLGIVLISGTNDETIQTRASEAGCDGYLHKAGLSTAELRKGVMEAHFIQTMRATLSILTDRRDSYLM